MARDGSSRKGDAPVSCRAFGPLANWAQALEGKCMGDFGLVLGMIVLFAAMFSAERDARRSLDRERARLSAGCGGGDCGHQRSGD